MSDNPSNGFTRPFPALTPEQRLYLEVYGYVVVPETLTRAECEEARAALIELREEARATAGGRETVPARNARVMLVAPHHTTFTALAEAHPSFARYACHPRLVGMAEELLGGEARITELDGIVNSRDPAQAVEPSPKFGFHTGTDVPFGSHTRNGLFHCNFVKTLTTLGDLGPDDGGTVVIAGSHKIDLPVQDIVECAYKDRRLIHQFVAPAGSTLLFGETLIHATGQLRSDRERALIITGYGPTMFPDWSYGRDGSQKLSERFIASVPAPLKTLFFGKAHWTRGPRYRKLADPVDARPIEPVKWPE
jgi:hypothetical protein